MASNAERSGRQYSNNVVKGKSRAHFGDNHYYDKTPEKKLLDSLWFEGMERYHEPRLESYPGTWSWIFDTSEEEPVLEEEDWSKRQHPEYRNFQRREALKFRDWLQASEETFWISGKAGSGKSCLMKFLSDHNRTKELLEKWAGTDIKIARFFFWRAGSQLEQSLVGLLRGLLHQILQESPALRNKLASEQQNQFHHSHWTHTRMLDIIEQINDQTSGSVRWCFFIDGLDEFSGLHYDLIQDLEKLRFNARIKLCVSSRPGNVFERAYGRGKPHSEQESFKLHELTKTDLKLYTQSLREDTRFIELCQKDRDAFRLVEKIEGRAHGVFLWVKLVISDLREGLGEHDDLAKLESRLERIPQDLDKFLHLIFNSIDKLYRTHMARTLLWLLWLTKQGQGHLPLLLHSYIDDAADPELYLKATFETMPNREPAERLINAANNARTWCKDLIDVETDDDEADNMELSHMAHASSTGNRIRFFHRSVFDFVQSKAREGSLQNLAGSRFAAPAMSMRALLFVIKRTSEVSAFGRLAHMLLDAAKNHDAAHAGLLTYHRTQIDWRDASIDVLDELERVGRKTLGDRMFFSQLGFWKKKFEQQTTFVACAIKFGMRHYLRKVMDSQMRMSHYTAEQKQLWLRAAVGDQGTLQVDLLIDMLERGIRPLQSSMVARASQFTLWQSFLLKLFSLAPWWGHLNNATELSRALQLMKMLLDIGCDPDVELPYRDVFVAIMKKDISTRTELEDYMFENVSALDAFDLRPEFGDDELWFEGMLPQMDRVYPPFKELLVQESLRRKGMIARLKLKLLGPLRRVCCRIHL